MEWQEALPRAYWRETGAPFAYVLYFLPFYLRGVAQIIWEKPFRICAAAFLLTFHPKTSWSKRRSLLAGCCGAHLATYRE